MRADRNAEVLKHMVKYCDQIEETLYDGNALESNQSHEKYCGA